MLHQEITSHNLFITITQIHTLEENNLNEVAEDPVSKLHSHKNVRKKTLELLMAADYSATEYYGKDRIESVLLIIGNMASFDMVLLTLE